MSKIKGLESKKIYKILKNKSVKYLYHANTLKTALTFIENNALLSRGYVEKKKLTQTIQNSDKKDKKFGVWNDVFLDGFDLHKKYSRGNLYGPVLFRFSLDMLLSKKLNKIYITRNNPIYWKDNNEISANYFSRTKEFKELYLNKDNNTLDSRLMLTFKLPENKIKLCCYLDSIVLDNPDIKLKGKKSKNVGVHMYEKVKQELEKQNLFDVKLKFRHKNEKNNCSCIQDYKSLKNKNKREFQKRFF